MLALNDSALVSLSRQRQQSFVVRLLEALGRDHPDLFDPLPVFVRASLVCNGLDRAASWGFTSEQALGMFVALQCETAPDFDNSEHVRPWLEAGQDDAERLRRLLVGVPGPVWTTIRRGADLDAWFAAGTAAQWPARIALPVCTVFPELVQRHRERALRQFFGAAPARAQRHGIRTPSDLAVFAAALAFYGDMLDQPAGPSWAKSLFDPLQPAAPTRLVALLRNALLQDSGRLV